MIDPKLLPQFACSRCRRRNKIVPMSLQRKGNIITETIYLCRECAEELAGKEIEIHVRVIGE